MEISGNNLNQPVSFYNKNTSNSINMAIESENYLYQPNIFTSELEIKKAKKNESPPFKKKRKSKRFNTIDTEYLPDEIYEPEEKSQCDNIFLLNEQNSILQHFKTTLNFFLTSIPLVNYFFLKEKQYKLKKTVESLNDISENIYELQNNTAPYGEEESIYQNIAENFTNAASILGKENKNIV